MEIVDHFLMSPLTARSPSWEGFRKSGQASTQNPQRIQGNSRRSVRYPVSRCVKAITPVDPLVMAMSKLDAAVPIIGPPITTVEMSSSQPTVSKMKRKVVPMGTR